jgi:hypothetical protein
VSAKTATATNTTIFFGIVTSPNRTFGCKNPYGFGSSMNHERPQEIKVSSANYSLAGGIALPMWTKRLK